MKNFRKQKKNLLDKNVIDEQTIIVATHFSHSAIYEHEILQAKLSSEGITPAFDGMEIKI